MFCERDFATSFPDARRGYQGRLSRPFDRWRSQLRFRRCRSLPRCFRSAHHIERCRHPRQKVGGMRGHKSSVLSPVVETTPTLPRSRMGNRPASAPRSAKVRADNKSWGSAPHSRRLCETLALLIRIRVGQFNSSRHEWFDRPSFRVPDEA